MYNNISSELLLQLDLAPKKPGVYIFRDSKEEVIYVGKSVNLYNRSRSYFANYKKLDVRLQNMVESAYSVEYLEADNEIEALLLETNLIKKYMPNYNILMTDDKNYMWVKITQYEDYPSVSIVHDKKDAKAEYLGPYPSSGPVRRMLKFLRRVFPYCTPEQLRKLNESAAQGKIEYSDKPCFYHHIGLCRGICVGKETKEEYRARISQLKRFLKSDQEQLKKDLAKQIEDLSEQRKYEIAAVVRDQLRDLNYLTQFKLIDEDVDEDVFRQRKMKRRLEGLEELIQKLKLDYPTDEAFLSQFKIECYDISNIQGTNATAAMVVSVAGLPKKNLYRKFKIKLKETPDDFAMMREALGRRLKYLQSGYKVKKLDESFEYAPQLIVVDGGKGQLSAALQVYSEFAQKIPVEIPFVGLAKREEEVFQFMPEKQEFRLIKLSRRSAALKILQNLRDEAHRFGLGYHRLLRSKGMFVSELDLIPGVGDTTKKALILAFGSVSGIRKAKLDELIAVVKNRKTAEKIKKLL
jgi:excinuclease ABC subunit C